MTFSDKSDHCERPVDPIMDPEMDPARLGTDCHGAIIITTIIIIIITGRSHWSDLSEKVI